MPRRIVRNFADKTRREEVSSVQKDSNKSADITRKRCGMS